MTAPFVCSSCGDAMAVGDTCCGLPVPPPEPDMRCPECLRERCGCDDELTERVVSRGLPRG